MTSFVLSHNLQIQNPAVPALSFEELAKGLAHHSPSVINAEAVSHPHWKIRLEASSQPEALAREIIQSWRKVRADAGHSVSHAIMALGGRKDTPGNPGAPLQEGGWGVDIVETADPDGFLTAINWTGLTSGRPADGVFEVTECPQ